MTREGYKKWKKVIKAWAKGEEVQFKVPFKGDWKGEDDPTFHPDLLWRVKPKEEIELELNAFYKFKQKELDGKWEYIGITTSGKYVFLNHAKAIAFHKPLKYISKRVQ